MSSLPGSSTTPSTTGTPDSAVPAEPRPRLGLRLRLWIGALAGVIAVAAGIAWAVAPAADLEREALLVRLAIAAGAGLALAVVLAVWLDRGIVSRVRRLARSAGGMNGAPIHADPAASRGWGELADLSLRLEALIARHRQAARSVEQLQALERQLGEAHAAARRWIETERWSGAAAASGALQPLAETLDRGFARQSEIAEQNRAAARQIGEDLVTAIDDAREAAEQSERGFVEVTALLTSIRELQRLAQDLHGRRAAAAEPSAAAAPPPMAAMVRELADAAVESVGELAGALQGVQEIAQQSQVLGNRSTLVALNALLALRAGADREGEVSAAELKQLAREARAATDRVQELAAAVQAQVAASSARVRAARDRMTSELEAPVVAGPVGAPDADTVHLLDRVREMVQDAASKAERLSAAGERASRAADRLARKLDEDVRDLEGLVVRLSPPGAEPAGIARSSREGEPSGRFAVIDRDAEWSGGARERGARERGPRDPRDRDARHPDLGGHRP